MRKEPTMRILHTLTAVALAGFLSMPAACADAAPAPAPEGKEGVSLTVYNQNFAVVREVRTLKVPEKVSEIRFRDVAKKIDPTSVHFKSLTDPGGTTVLEQNYEFDLVSADKLLDKYIDKPITVDTQDGKRYEGTLLSFDSGQLVLQGARDLVMVQRPDNIRNIEFSRLPEGLLTRPTLVWTVATGKPGDHLAQVTYQTGGMTWRADYSAIVADDEKTMDLAGWVTVTNQSGARYEAARLKLMAGDVRRIQPPQPRRQVAFAEAARKAGAGAGVEEKAFFEYHLYTLERPTTLNENQVKQVELLAADAVPLKKTYVFEPMGRYGHRRYGEPNTYKVNVFVEFTNDEASRLGMPLPKGKVRVYKRDADTGDVEFIGEDEVDHTPKDEELKLYVGDAFDLVGERILTDQKQQQRWREESYRLVLRNHKDEAVTILCREHLTHHGTWQIKAKSQDFRKVDAHTIEFEVPVKADGKAEVTYTVHYSW
jgi:hypothetical protein